MQKNLSAKSQIYFFLANVFAKEPTSEFLKKLHDDETQKTLKEFDLWVSVWDGYNPLEEVRESLACEYTRLFIGPGKQIASHESIIRGEGQYWGDVVVSCLAAYQQNGFEIGMEQFKAMPDHVSCELEFMGYLIEKEERMRKKKDVLSVEKLRKTQRIFLEEHLLSWIPKFVQMISRKAQKPYYDQFGKFLVEHLEKERQNLVYQSHI